jgi:hypothetical protein
MTATDAGVIIPDSSAVHNLAMPVRIAASKECAICDDLDSARRRLSRS